jgi:transcriptional regulator with XRE-family HTH domain
MKTVGERIRTRRTELGWTQEQLAQRAGLSKGFISDVESGKRHIGADSLLALATVLGVSMDHLMKGGPSRSEFGAVKIPGSLSAFASSAQLGYAQTLMLLDLRKQILAHRSSSQSDDLEQFDWPRFYHSVKEFLK